MKQLALDIDCETKRLVRAWMEIAFLAGRWHGQVDLEERMDNNYFDAFMGAISARKTGMPLHTVAGGIDDTGCFNESRPVRYLLRPEKWRENVSKMSKEELENAIKELTNALTKKD